MNEKDKRYESTSPSARPASTTASSKDGKDLSLSAVDGADAVSRHDSDSPLVPTEDELLHSQRAPAPVTRMVSLTSKSEPRQTRAGTQAVEPGAYRVTLGRLGSSDELTDEEGDPNHSPTALLPLPDAQPESQQGDLAHQVPSQLPSTVPVQSDMPSLDLAPLIIEATVVPDTPDSGAAPRSIANKPVLVEGRRETPNRRRIVLTLFGLLTLGIAVGVSVGITQNRSPSSTSSSNATSTPTAPPTLRPTTVAVMQDFLTSLPEPTKSKIESDSSSPQARAFTWLSSPLHPRYATNARQRYEQRFALATFYFSTGGDTWNNNDGWLNETIHECNWYGSLCVTSKDAVQTLKLDTNNLTGTIPTEIGLLTGLDTLGLYVNNLRGKLPTEIGLLTRMLNLYVDDNKNLTGPLPTELALLPDLATLVLNNCHFTGSIPTSFGKLSKLVYFVVSNSSLTSTIPTELGRLSMLDSLFLDNNQLVGTIPTELGLLSVLYKANLGHNALTGRVPSEMVALPAIGELNLQNNSLSGRIPKDWMAAEYLSTVNLDNNNLTGPIPGGMANLTFLTMLDVHANRLTGTVPDGVCQLVSSGGLSVEIDCNEVACDCGCMCA